jgi:hypothetical protein
VSAEAGVGRLFGQAILAETTTAAMTLAAPITVMASLDESEGMDEIHTVASNGHSGRAIAVPTSGSGLRRE